MHKKGTFWTGLKPLRGPIKTNGETGPKRRLYTWDHTHGDVEVYNGQGRHIGTADPETGQIIEGPVRGRTIQP
jgi:hypothetical protein